MHLLKVSILEPFAPLSHQALPAEGVCLKSHAMYYHIGCHIHALLTLIRPVDVSAKATKIVHYVAPTHQVKGAYQQSADHHLLELAPPPEN